MNYRSKARAIASALIAAATLIACGATTTTTTTAPTAPQSSTQATAAATASTVAEPTAGSASASSPTSAADATTPPAATSASDATTAPAATSSAAAATAAKLNLNEVTEDQLLSTIPNFPNRMVREFFEYRPYVSIQQFRKEIGKYVSAEQVAAYEQYVYVPIDVNNADAATVQQLPGVDATTAQALVAGRPYASNATFLAKLAELAPSADPKQAQAYLAAQ